jgi:hypothetical protein
MGNAGSVSFSYSLDAVDTEVLVVLESFASCCCGATRASSSLGVEEALPKMPPPPTPALPATRFLSSSMNYQ